MFFCRCVTNMIQFSNILKACLKFDASLTCCGVIGFSDTLWCLLKCKKEEHSKLRKTGYRYEADSGGY